MLVKWLTLFIRIVLKAFDLVSHYIGLFWISFCCGMEKIFWLVVGCRFLSKHLGSSFEVTLSVLQGSALLK